jgi:hypothetical protein
LLNNVVVNHFLLAEPPMGVPGLFNPLPAPAPPPLPLEKPPPLPFVVAGGLDPDGVGWPTVK